jgi:hypothetical protein
MCELNEELQNQYRLIRYLLWKLGGDVTITPDDFNASLNLRMRSQVFSHEDKPGIEGYRLYLVETESEREAA